MAVTQLIARIPMAYVEKAKQDVSTLDKLISFDFLADDDDVLDLDWMPAGLFKLAEKLSKNEYEAICQAIEGELIVNSEFPTGPDDYAVYSDIKYLHPDKVVEISQILKSIDIEKFMQSLPSNDDETKKFLGIQNLPTNAYDYYKNGFKDLVNYVDGAAEQKLALVMWWD